MPATTQTARRRGASNTARRRGARRTRREATARLLAALVVSAGLGWPARAQPPAPPLACPDLGSCIALALRSHPQRLTAAARLAAAEAGVRAASAARRPTLLLEAGPGVYTGELVSPFTVLGGRAEEPAATLSPSGLYYASRVRLELPVLRDAALVGRPSAAERASRLLVEEQGALAEASRVRLALGVAAAYFPVLRHEAAVPILERILATERSRRELLASEFAQRTLARTALLSAEVAESAARSDLAVAERARDQSAHALRAAVGAPGEGEIRVVDGADPTFLLRPLEALLERLREAPVLRAQALRVRAGQLAAASAADAGRPDLTVLARYGLAGSFEPVFNQQWDAQVALSIPLLDGGRVRARADRARAEADAEQAALAELGLALEGEVRSRFYRVQEIDQASALVDERIAAAAEARDLVERSYREGAAPLLEVHDAEVDLLRLRLARSDASFERRRVQGELRILVEGPGGSTR